MAKKVFKEGKWRCTHIDLSGEDACNHVNRGPALKCEKCGKHRPKDVVFYVPKNAPIIKDAHKIADATSGANWHCFHCNYHNKASSDICVHCDTPRDKEYEEWIGLGGDLKTKSYSGGQAPTGSQKKAAAKEYVPVKQRFKKIALMAGISLVAILAIVFIYRQFFATENLKVEVTGYSWERQVEIEKSRTVREEAWNIPSGGKKIKSERRKSGTKQVYDHSEWDEEPIYEDVQVGTQQVECGTVDKGNGYFETQYCEEPIYESQQVGTERVEREVYRDEPVYDTWYTYEIDRWELDRSPIISGKDHHPKWPDYNLNNREREGQRTEKYVVNLKVIGGDSDHSALFYETNEGEWNSIMMGEQFTAKVRKSGTVVSLGPPE
ncbi:MAG: Ran-binding zinc finger domain-containing protein [Crocinitomicaceae bacterium]